MLPDEYVRSVDKWLDDLNAPKDRKHASTRSFCSGGAAIGDTSKGIKAYTWQAWTDGSAVYLKRSDKGRVETILTDKGISEVSVAFDRQMNLVIAYQAGIESKLWVGRDNGSIVGDIVETIRGGKSPRVALDDNRYANASTSDVIFAYVKDSALYCRYQRDDYSTEYKLQDFDENTTLYRISMGKDNRFVFLLQREIKG